IGDVDVPKFGHPEWVPLDLKALDDEPLSVLVGYEDAIGPVTDVVKRLGQGSDYSKAALLWLARVRAGIATVPFREFDVHPRRIKTRVASGDAVPPPDGSSEPSPPAE